MLEPSMTRACYRRDGWRCRHCNDRNSLHPHHVVYKSHQGPDELWNLITLCAQCHNAHHEGKLLVIYPKDTWAVLKDNYVRFMRVNGWRPQ